jgi:hypothetical protein
MKKLNYWAAYLVVLTMIFTSCSKDENDVMETPQAQDLIQLQFGALLNDFSSKQATKDHLDPPACSETAPSYVHVALQYPDDSWVDGKDGDNEQFIQIPINWNPNTLLWETAYSPVLGLPAATYSLEYFIVYNSLNEVIWVAPREGGAYEDYVPNPLPEDIVLVAGSKPYFSVDVLCFDTRQEDAYGYIFFDLNTYRAENDYCIFVNYCDRVEGGDGREYPAKFMVEAWKDAFDGNQSININPNMNVISAGPAASVLCFNLPVLQGDDTHFIRVTVMDHQLLPYNVDEQNPPIYEFEVSQSDIEDQLLLTPKYDHIRLNCPPIIDEPCIVEGDTNGDCIVDCKDTSTPPCPDDCVPGSVDGDTNGDCVVNCLDEGQDPCPNYDDCDSTDTFWMKGDRTHWNKDNPNDNLYIGNNWGWAEFFDRNDGSQGTSFNLYAGAGQNNIGNADLAGTVMVEILPYNNTHEMVKFTIMEQPGMNLDKVDYYVSDVKPVTNSPGQFKNYSGGATGIKPLDGVPNSYYVMIPKDSDFWMMIHGESCSLQVVE